MDFTFSSIDLRSLRTRLYSKIRRFKKHKKSSQLYENIFMLLVKLESLEVSSNTQGSYFATKCSRSTFVSISFLVSFKLKTNSIP